MSLSLGERLDRLSWSPLHTRITAALGVGWLLDAFEVNIIGDVLGVLKKIWAMTDLQASALVTVWLVGIMAGALVFGYLADRLGRRRLFLATLVMYATCTVASAFSLGPSDFFVLRFLTAVGVGAEYAAINAAIGELIPARFRGRANAAVMNFWPIGAILAALVSAVFIQHLPEAWGWRVAFGLGGLIALTTMWMRTVLPESPRWLWQRGQEAEALSILEGMEAGQQDFTAATAPASTSGPGFFEQLSELVRRWPGRLALGCLLDFSEAAGYYGIFAFLPLLVLPAVHIDAAHVPMFFLWGNVGAACGGALAAWALDGVGRKSTVTTFYALAAASMLGMAWATSLGSASGVLAAFMVANFCATGAWVSAYPTFSELFPTALRSTGIGFSVAFGRIGAAAAPPLLVWVSQHASMGASFAILAACWALGALVMVPWNRHGLEARGLSLEQTA